MWGLIFRLFISAVRATSTASVRLATYGRLSFVGLIARRPLASVTQQEVRNAFAKIGLREAHNSHFISRLIERGPQFGIHSLDDFARALNGSVGRAGSQAGTTELLLPNGRAAVVINTAGELITFLPL